MTATAPQQLPPPIITVAGQLLNADVETKHIDELQWYAQTEKFDLEGECFSRYGYKSEWLTVTQLGEMFRAITTAAPSVAPRRCTSTATVRASARPAM